MRAVPGGIGASSALVPETFISLRDGMRWSRRCGARALRQLDASSAARRLLRTGCPESISRRAPREVSVKRSLARRAAARAETPLARSACAACCWRASRRKRPRAPRRAGGDARSSSARGPAPLFVWKTTWDKAADAQGSTAPNAAPPASARDSPRDILARRQLSSTSKSKATRCSSCAALRRTARGYATRAIKKGFGC